MSERRRIGGVGMAALVAVLAVPAARAGDAGKAVLEAQDRRFALTAGGDLDELERMLTDDMNYTHSSAAVDTKTEFLGALRSGTVRYLSIELEERTVRVYRDAGVVQGIAHVLVKAGDRDIDPTQAL